MIGRGRLRAVGHGPDFQILIVEAVADEARRMAREAIDHAAEERGLRVAEVCWDPAADAEGLKWLIVAAAHRRSEERRVGKECRSRWSPYH